MSGQELYASKLGIDSLLSDILANRNRPEASSVPGSTGFLDLINSRLETQAPSQLVPVSPAKAEQGVLDAAIGAVNPDADDREPKTLDPGAGTQGREPAKALLAPGQVQTRDKTGLDRSKTGLESPSALEKALVKPGESRKDETSPDRGITARLAFLGLGNPQAEHRSSHSKIDPLARRPDRTEGRHPDLPVRNESNGANRTLDAFAKAVQEGARPRTQVDALDSKPGSTNGLERAKSFLAQVSGELEGHKTKDAPRTETALGLQVKSGTPAGTTKDLESRSQVRTGALKAKTAGKPDSLEAERAPSSTDLRLKATKDPQKLGTRIEVEDITRTRTGRIDLAMGDRQQNPVLTQTLARTALEGSTNESSGKRQGPGVDFATNAAFLPSRERVVQLPVLANQAGSFGQSMRDWLRGQGGREIAQEARILLKDSQSGEIRLILKPEALGEVRIQLQMQDGAIGGTILVENEEVRNAFLADMDALTKAFEDSGFQTGGLQVAVGNQGQHSGKGDRQDFEGQVRKLKAIRQMAEQVPVAPGYERADTRIDLVV